MCSNFFNNFLFILGFKSLCFILVILFIAQETSFCTSTHLWSIDFELRITMMNLNSFLEIVAAKQGPAVGVIPVLRPENPCSKSLLVFYQ